MQTPQWPTGGGPPGEADVSRGRQGGCGKIFLKFFLVDGRVGAREEELLHGVTDTGGVAAESDGALHAAEADGQAGREDFIRGGILGMEGEGLEGAVDHEDDAFGVNAVHVAPFLG